MAVYGMRCPACGAAIETGLQDGLCVCRHCGLVLRLDASGRALALLTGVSADTAFLARDRAYQLLEQQYQQLLEQRWQLYAEWSTARAAVQTQKGSGWWVFLGILLLPFLVGIVFLAVPIIQSRSRRKRLAEVDARYRTRIAELDRYLAALKEKMDTVAAERDRLMGLI